MREACWLGRCGGCEAEHVAYGVGLDCFRRGLRRFPIGNCGARVEGFVRPHPHETIATSLVAAYIGDGGRSPMPRTLPPVGPIPDLPAPNNRSLSMPRLSAFTSRGCRKECEKAIAREDEHSASARATALVGHAMSVEGAQAAVVVDDPCGRATVLASHGFEPPNVPLLSLFRAYEATRKTLGLPRNVTASRSTRSAPGCWCSTISASHGPVLSPSSSITLPLVAHFDTSEPSALLTRGTARVAELGGATPGRRTVFASLDAESLGIDG